MYQGAAKVLEKLWEASRNCEQPLETVSPRGEVSLQPTNRKKPGPSVQQLHEMNSANDLSCLRNGFFLSLAPR